MWLTLAGLVLDVLGASLLVKGLLYRDLAVIRQGYRAMAKPETWSQSVAFAVARRTGSQNPMATMDHTVEELEQVFWGWILLVGGFILQALGAWVAR